MENFLDKSYNREKFTKFIGNFLPDDFTPTEQDLDYQKNFFSKSH